MLKKPMGFFHKYSKQNKRRKLLLQRLLDCLKLRLLLIVFLETLKETMFFLTKNYSSILKRRYYLYMNKSSSEGFSEKLSKKTTIVDISPGNLSENVSSLSREELPPIQYPTFSLLRHSRG